MNWKQLETGRLTICRKAFQAPTIRIRGCAVPFGRNSAYSGISCCPSRLKSRLAKRILRRLQQDD